MYLMSINLFDRLRLSILYLLILGNLMTYMASSLRRVDPDMEYGMMLWVSGTCRVVGGSLCGPLGGLSCRYLGYKYTCLLGGLLFR